MGKFDGILIATDWDGTLFNGKEIPETNLRAIKYFKDNGGRFTICSGRPPKYVRDMSDVCKPNTYVACLNGAIVYDPETDKIISEGFVDEEAYEILDKIVDCGVEITRITFEEIGHDDFYEFTPNEYKLNKADMKSRKIYKITVLATDAAGGEMIMGCAAKTEMHRHGVMRSYGPLAEILNNDFTKGKAALYIKEAIGAHTLIGVGDYENDIPLLECADVGYAVGNAIDTVKAVADRVTVSVFEGAIAAIVAELDKTIS